MTFHEALQLMMYGKDDDIAVSRREWRPNGNGTFIYKMNVYPGDVIFYTAKPEEDFEENGILLKQYYEGLNISKNDITATDWYVIRWKNKYDLIEIAYDNSDPKPNGELSIEHPLPEPSAPVPADP